jgi:hypothetical protein
MPLDPAQRQQIEQGAITAAWEHDPATPAADTGVANC